MKNLLLSATPTLLKPCWRRLEASPLGCRLAKGAFWSLAGTLLSRAFTLLSSILVARLLGKVGLGELGIIQNTVGIFSSLAGLGIGLTATKYVAQYRDHDPRRAGAMLRLSAIVAWSSGLLLTLAMLLLAPWFATHTIAAPHLAPLLRVGSLLLLLGAVNGAQTGGLAGFEAFGAIARINLLIGILTLPTMLLGAAFFGLTGAVWGLVAVTAANCICSHLHLRRQAAAANIPLRAPFEDHEWTVLWNFSLPAALCGLLVGPTTWACSALLVNRPNGYAEMGLFNATLSWFSAVTFLPTVLGQVLLPVLSSEQAAVANRTPRLVLLATKANALAVLPLALLIASLSPAVMSAYGPGFREGWPTLVLTVLTAAVVAIHGPAAQSLIAGSRMWPYLLMCLAWAILCLGGTLFAVRFGAFGLAAARLLAYLISSTAVILYAAHCCRAPPPSVP